MTMSQLCHILGTAFSLFKMKPFTPRSIAGIRQSRRGDSLLGNNGIRDVKITMLRYNCDVAQTPNTFHYFNFKQPLT